MQKTYGVAMKVKKYYYLHLLGESDLKPIYEHYIQEKPEKEIIAEDMFAQTVIDLIEEKVSLSEFLGYNIEESSFAMHEEIKSGICYNISLLEAAFTENETHQISLFEIDRPYLYRVIKNIDKLP